jgi:hypothetical protein
LLGWRLRCAFWRRANTSDAPLPMVHQDDPTWGLVPDHLDFGALPQ